RFVTQLGEERALARARALAAPCPVDLRVDLSRITREEVRARLIEDGCSDHIEAPEAFPTVLRVHAGGRLDAHPLHEDGRFSIQALGAQQAAIMLSPRPGERILDACAGMGTKTLQLAELMARRGAIVAADRSAARLAEQARARARGGLDAPGLTVRVVEADLTGDAPEVDGDGLYDGVLLDAPCTGLGNLARHPERRWAAAAEDIADCAALQARLLARCWQRVRPGGRLVYAVCSLEPEEGPALVAAFAKEHGLQVIREETYTPEEHGADGFYAARIEGRGA
ncbi:MAG: RsmB/NOP family class I SAM-dependent RNA methyltransferase, partial [Myxococcales bacterium]|nr:RsmB/NOP family class I SAM-dependent RNA methyltransferase [Myxococcales bacterium]